MTSDSLTPEERQRVKVAFAEGYIAGNGIKTPGRTLTWLKIIQQTLMITIVLAIFISIMGKFLLNKYLDLSLLSIYHD